MAGYAALTVWPGHLWPLYRPIRYLAEVVQNMPSNENPSEALPSVCWLEPWPWCFDTQITSVLTLLRARLTMFMWTYRGYQWGWSCCPWCSGRIWTSHLLALCPRLLPRFAPPAGVWKMRVVSDGVGLVWSSVMETLGLDLTMAASHLQHWLKWPPQTYSLYQPPPRQSVLHIFSLSLSFSTYKVGIMSPFLKAVVQVTLSNWLRVGGAALKPVPGGHRLVLPPEPDSPCPAQRSHTLWARRAWQTLGGCRSHPKLRCGPVQWILCPWGSLQGERTCHCNGLSWCVEGTPEGVPFSQEEGLWKRGQGGYSGWNEWKR